MPMFGDELTSGPKGSEPDTIVRTCNRGFTCEARRVGTLHGD